MKPEGDDPGKTNTMIYQDYYEILGVARDASPAEIKAAFRKLARRYHPKLQEPDAEKKFREVNEAYLVLSDRRKRARYDQFGPDGFGTPENIDNSSGLMGGLFRLFKK